HPFLAVHIDPDLRAFVADDEVQGLPLMAGAQTMARFEAVGDGAVAFRDPVLDGADDFAAQVLVLQRYLAQDRVVMESFTRILFRTRVERQELNLLRLGKNGTRGLGKLVLLALADASRAGSA